MFSFFKKKPPTDIDEKLKDALDYMKSGLDSTNLNNMKEAQQLGKYFNNIPILYAIVDRSGMLVRFNRSFTSVIGCDEKECLGMNIKSYIHNDDLNDFISFKENLKKNSSEDVNVISRMMDNNGVVTYVKWGGVNQDDDQLLILFGQDVTEEVKLSDKLKSFVSYKNAILDNYPGSLMSTDLNGIIKEFNKTAEINSGYKKEDLIYKKHIFDLFPDKNLFKEGNMNAIYKTNLKRSSGELIISYILLLPLIKDDRMVGYFGIWHDESYINYIKTMIV